MFDLKKTRKSKFRKVPLLITSIVAKGGQKTVTHEFVNSDDRVVEPLGILGDSFVVSAIVHGVNYLRDRKALIEVMKEKITGDFIHPYEGTLNVFPTSYSINESDDEFGMARFTLNFTKVPKDTNFGLPIIVSPTVSQNQKLADTANEKIAATFATDFRTSTQSNIEAAEAVLKNVSKTMKKIVATANSAEDQISTVTNGINNFTDDIISLINIPSELGTRLTALIGSITQLVEIPEDVLASLTKLFNFGDDDVNSIEVISPLVPVDPTSRVTIERQTNQNMIQTAMQTTALSLAHVSATQLTYGNTSEIDEIIKLLSNQFNKTVGNVEIGIPDINTKIFMSLDTINAMNNLANNTREFLEQEKINTSIISNVESKLTSASTLTYLLYGTTENIEEIIQLNDFGDVSNIDGTIKVLSQ